MLEFSRPINGLLRDFRLVDKAGCFSSNDIRDTNCVIEYAEGWDAMGHRRWAPAGEEGVLALLNELTYCSITRNAPSRDTVAA